MRVFHRILIVSILLAVGGCLTVGPLSYDPTASSGQILLYADPGIRVERAGRLVAYAPGLTVLTGDRISTSSGQAVIDYDDDNIVVLNSSTQVELGSIKLFLGEVFARIRNITRRGGGRVITDEISAAVTGTEYAVRRTMPGTAPRNGVSTIIVREGRVNCEPGNNATWKPFDMQPDQSFSTGAYGAEPELTSIDAADATRWADRAIQRLLEPRVSKPSFNLVFPVGGFGGEHRDEHY